MKKNLLMCLALMAASSVHADLVVNGGFETGDFTGWTQFGNIYSSAVVGSYDGVNPNSGSDQAGFGAVGSIAGIEQTLNVTAGQSYQISFWLYNIGGTPSEIQLGWGGNTILDTVNPDAFPYTEYTETVTADASTDLLSFGFQQDQSYFFLDDVSVTPTSASPVPEPATVFAGVLLLLPLGVGAVRQFRNKAQRV
jgi:hypothetical protein